MVRSSVFSFHPVKIITTGEGGAVLTNNKFYAEKLRCFRNGITTNKHYFKHKPYYSGYYEQMLIGYNYRMSDISAALGINQLRHLKKFISERNKIANYYKKCLHTHL